MPNTEFFVGTIIETSGNGVIAFSFLTFLEARLIFIKDNAVGRGIRECKYKSNHGYLLFLSITRLMISKLAGITSSQERKCTHARPFF